MMVYILKATVCLALFIAFYKLFLERENMHVFKRFYLLAAFLVAFIIPSVVFTEYVYIEPQSIIQSYTSDYTLEGFHSTATPEKTNYLNALLWSIYGLGVLVFGFKFFKNLFKIGYRIQRNPKIKSEHIINVLLKEKLVPHTFFNFIFLNKQKFEAQEIPNEVLLHEKTHADQKHSIDVLFIEFLQVILWFNPLVYVFKNAVKLNHEFLADHAVMQKGIETTSYQKILLAFSSNANNQETALTNAINYSSIKKRFTVMKKNTSKKAIWLRSLLVLPVFALALYSFSETQVLEIEKQSENIDSSSTNLEEIQTQKSDSIRDLYITKPNAPTASDIKKWKNISEYALWINGKSVNNSELENYSPSDFAHYSSSFVYNNARSKRFPQPYQVSLFTQSEFEKQFSRDDTDIKIRTFNSENSVMVQNSFIKIAELNNYLLKLNKKLTKEDRKKIVRVSFFKNPKTSKKVMDAIQVILDDYGYATLDIKGSQSEQEGVTEEQLLWYNTTIKNINKNPESQRIFKLKDVQRLEHIYSLMSEKQKIISEDFPKFPPPPAMDTIYTYERLLKRIKTNPSNRKANLIYLNKLYDDMNLSQREKVENPYFVKNQLQQEGATKEQVSEYNSLASKYNAMNPNNMRIKKSEVDRMDYLYSLMTGKQKKQAESYPDIPPMPEPPMAPSAPKVMKDEVSSIPPPPPAPPMVLKGEDSNIPPPPPAPKSPLDHVIEMAKKDASFYYEDKEISSDKAIELLKNNKNLNIDTRNSNSKNPVVRITKEPISIKN